MHYKTKKDVTQHITKCEVTKIANGNQNQQVLNLAATSLHYPNTTQKKK